MPDLLVFAQDNASCFELEKLGQTHGFRVKQTVELKTALEWLKLKSFDVAFVAAAIPFETLQKLADLLWHQNQLAIFATYDFDEPAKKQDQEVRLFGAEVVRGPNVLEKLATHLKAVTPTTSVCADSFKILVVEDLDSPRDIICTYIETLGFPRVKGVQSVKEAISELDASGDYSCIVTDIRMPELSGQRLIEYVRQHNAFKNLPILALTAYGTPDCLIDSLKAGASGFLVKPPKKNDLSRELGRALRIKARGGNPRLATPEEAELLREVLSDRGLF